MSKFLTVISLSWISLTINSNFQNFHLLLLKISQQPNTETRWESENRTENNVDAEIVPPNEPRNTFDLVRFQRRRDSEARGVHMRVAGAWVVGEYNCRCGFEPLLIIHLFLLKQTVTHWWEREILLFVTFWIKTLERESEWYSVSTKMAFKEFSIYRKSRCSFGVVWCVCYKG